MIILHEVTIKDVARVAGVSMSTVNKALTGKTGISAELKKRVLDTVEKLNYQPNKAAGAIARNRVHIGIIIPDDWEKSCYETVKGIEHRMEILADWNFASKTMKYSVQNSDTDKNVLDCLKKLHEKKIKAFILCKSDNLSYEKSIEYAIKNDIKVVCMGYYKLSSNSNFLTVDANAYKCGEIAAGLFESFIREGESVAAITDNTEIWAQAEKIRGFEERIKAGNKLMMYGVVHSGNNNYTSYDITSKLISENIKAIFAPTSTIDGVCRAIKDSGKNIKLISTDLSEDCVKYIKQNIITATINQNEFIQGIAAVNAFYDYFLFGDTPPKELLVFPTLYTKECLTPDYKIDIYNYYV